ncbi:MAG: hypothetical protein ACREVK_10970 [Gammaproteobacteria bacterium]
MIFDPPIYSLSDFTKTHNLTPVRSHRLFHDLGLKPRMITIGEKQFVTREAAVEWRKMVEDYAEQHGGKIEL